MGKGFDPSTSLSELRLDCSHGRGESLLLCEPCRCCGSKKRKISHPNSLPSKMFLLSPSSSPDSYRELNSAPYPPTPPNSDHPLTATPPQFPPPAALRRSLSMPADFNVPKTPEKINVENVAVSTTSPFQRSLGRSISEKIVRMTIPASSLGNGNLTPIYGRKSDPLSCSMQNPTAEDCDGKKDSRDLKIKDGEIIDKEEAPTVEIKEDALTIECPCGISISTGLFF